MCERSEPIRLTWGNRKKAIECEALREPKSKPKAKRKAKPETKLKSSLSEATDKRRLEGTEKPERKTLMSEAKFTAKAKSKPEREQQAKPSRKASDTANSNWEGPQFTAIPSEAWTKGKLTQGKLICASSYTGSQWCMFYILASLTQVYSQLVSHFIAERFQKLATSQKVAKTHSSAECLHSANNILHTSWLDTCKYRNSSQAWANRFIL